MQLALHYGVDSVKKLVSLAFVSMAGPLTESKKDEKRALWARRFSSYTRRISSMSMLLRPILSRTELKQPYAGGDSQANPHLNRNRMSIYDTRNLTDLKNNVHDCGNGSSGGSFRAQHVTPTPSAPKSNSSPRSLAHAQRNPGDAEVPKALHFL